MVVRKKNLFVIAYVVWFVLLVGAFFGVISRFLEPYLPYSLLPGVGWRPFPQVPPEVYLLATVAVLGIAGMAVLRLLQKWSWLRTGEAAGLSREGGLFPTPPLVGTVQGRDVRARVVKRESSSSTRNDSTTASYTVVEARLDDPIEDGVSIERGADDPGLLGGLFGGDSDGTDRDGSTVAIAGDGSDRPDLSRRSRDALEDVTYFGHLSAGAVPDDRIGATGTLKRTFLGAVGSGTLAESYSDDVHDDASWVTHETRGVILNAGEMERQVEAVVAAAESFDEPGKRP